MQACLPRSYLTPVRDEEAESQRKARSRQARQTRRSTQGVTLTDLREAQRSYGHSSSDRHTGESQKTGTEEPGVDSQAGQREAEESRPRRNREVDDLGNLRTWVEAQAESCTTPSASPHRTPPSPTKCLSSLGLDPNGNELEGADQGGGQDEPSEAELRQRQRPQTLDQSLSADTSDGTQKVQREEVSPQLVAKSLTTILDHDRASRLDSVSGSSSTDSTTERLLGRTGSYTRRENRLASLNKPDQEGSSKEYKKMYEDALAENEKLKSRLEDSKQELAKVRTQLEKVTQKQDRISERSSVLESEKREKRILEKKVSEMEEELKVLTELKTDNQRLKDENGALIRVISKLSK
ncbi:protein phosphatase 1 regulatory subunit 12B-like isoform X1 [Paramormyrops kingsleyae]|uniref:Protein phosphatase 1 regulatory subunit 12B-like n=1 Tax=Paramormyrops kingsleyae TaxID=1676925 RepID=A0A3B3SEC2_9TELE|nr:protein phosphatase 1 regulatory subunit 12B-like isoform X1 [Paramormyrops kingsleyae]